MLNEERLRAMLTEFFDERARVDAETHGIHHEWIACKIESEKTRCEMFASVAKAAVSWSVPAVLSALAYFVFHGKWPGG